MIVRGANYPKQARDTYNTPREPIVSLLRTVQFKPLIYDPCCGNGQLLRTVAEYHNYKTFGSDIAPWGDYAKLDFLSADLAPITSEYDIVTNPPYGIQGHLAIRFIEKSLIAVVRQGTPGKVAMILPMDFDSGKTRVHIFRDHPAFTMKIVLLNRPKWFAGKAGQQNFAWFVWNWLKPLNQRPTIEYV